MVTHLTNGAPLGVSSKSRHILIEFWSHSPEAIIHSPESSSIRPNPVVFDRIQHHLPFPIGFELFPLKSSAHSPEPAPVRPNGWSNDFKSSSKHIVTLNLLRGISSKCRKVLELCTALRDYLECSKVPWYSSLLLLWCLSLDLDPFHLELSENTWNNLKTLRGQEQGKIEFKTYKTNEKLRDSTL